MVELLTYMIIPEYDLLFTILNAGNINHGDPQGLKFYPQATKYNDKEADKLYISVSNAKDIIYHFLILANKYG